MSFQAKAFFYSQKKCNWLKAEIEKKFPGIQVNVFLDWGEDGNKEIAIEVVETTVFKRAIVEDFVNTLPNDLH